MSGEGNETTLNPTRAMVSCLSNPLYSSLKIEEDLEQWEVLVSEDKLMQRAEKIHGENGELVHASNESALVALFFEAVPGIGAAGLEALLDAAFEENPQIALKLLFNLGTVRKNAAGKADRENFQHGLLWLWRKWPKTYLLNVAMIAKFASLKELLSSTMFILYEHERDSDPEGYSLFSLVGQQESLSAHVSRKRRRDDQARRRQKKARRLQLWSDFARSEKRELFGDLRVTIELDVLCEKLGIEPSVGGMSIASYEDSGCSASSGEDDVDE